VVGGSAADMFSNEQIGRYVSSLLSSTSLAELWGISALWLCIPLRRFLGPSLGL
jgi:hypothetical protein